MQGTCDIRTTIRGRVPRIPFADIKDTILGKNYSLSVVICGDALAQRLNTEYRKKTYQPNVLSFPLDDHEGEIFLNIRSAEREAKAAHISTKKRMALLFVHGCFHLKGMDHSDAMEREEQNVLKKFTLA